jgi:hypothetical protein
MKGGAGGHGVVGIWRTVKESAGILWATPLPIYEYIPVFYQLSLFFYPEDGASKFLRKPGNDLLDYMVTHHRTQ